jgi:hypothetical protein
MMDRVAGRLCPQLCRFLVDAHHQWKLLRLAQLIDLGRKIQSPHRHLKQEPQPSHDAVAGTDAHVRLGQVQLKAADIIKGRCIRGLL